MEGLSGVLLGAFLALLGGVVTLVVEKKWEARETRRTTESEQSVLAFSLMVKLTEIRGWNNVIHRSILECFDDAVGTPLQDGEPGIKVQPLLGASTRVDNISTQELALVLKCKDQGLLGRVLQLQANYRATFEVVQHFNSLRKEFTRFLQENADIGELSDGQFSKVVLSKRMGERAESHLAELNQLVGKMLESAEEDRNATETLILRLRSSLSSLAGVEFPSITFPRDAEKC